MHSTDSITPSLAGKSFTQYITIYLISIGFVVAAFVFRSVLHPSLSEEAPFLLFYTAIVAATGRGGLRAGLLATITAFVLHLYAQHVAGSIGSSYLLRLVFFVLEGTAISILIYRLRVSRELAIDAQAINQERLQLALEAAKISLYTNDLDLKYTWISRVHPSFDLSMIIGKRDDELLPKANVAELMALKREVIASGERKRQYIHTTIGEETFSFFVIADPIVTSSKNIAGVTVATVDVTDATRLQNALEDQKRFTDSILRTLPAVVYVFDIQEQENRFVNAYAEAALGYTPEEIIAGGASLFATVMHPDDQLEVAKQLTILRDLEGSEPITTEYRMQHKNGEWVWFAAQYTVFRRDHNRDVLEILGLAQDITGRKQAEEALRNSQEKFRVALQSTSVIVAQADRDLRYTWLHNPHPAFDPNSSLGKRDGELNPGEGSRQLMALKRRVLETAQGAHEQITFEVSGSIQTYAVTAEPLINSSGEMIGVTTVALEVTEYERVQFQLRESETMRLLALEAANLGVFDYDISQDSVEWDTRLRELWDVASDEHIDYQTFMDGVHPDDREFVQTAVDQSMKPDGEGHYFAKYRVIHRTTGDIRWISAVGKTYFEGEQPVRLIGVVQDITQEKSLQTKLETALAQFEHLSDAMPHLVWTANERAEANYYNKRVNEFDGITQNPDGTWTYQPVFHPDDVEQTLSAWHYAVAHNEPYEFEHRVRMADGSYRWHISRAVCEKSPDGVKKWYGTATDIHELKEVQQSLRESEARFRNMADNAPMMVWVTEADGTCTYLSQSWYDFTGRTPETGLGFGWLEATHPDDRERPHQIFTDAYQRQEAFSIDYRLCRTDGEYRWVIDSARPRFTEDGKFVGYIGSVIDITERKQKEDLVRQQRTILQQLVDSLPIMITIYEPNAGVLYLNNEFKRLTGWNSETAANVDFMAEVYPDPEYRAMVLEYMQSLEPGWRDFQVTARAGTIITSSWANIRLADGRHVGIGIDLRERLRNEKRNQILRTVATALSKAMSPEEVTEISLRGAFVNSNAVAGTVAIVSSDGQHLEIVGTYGYPNAIVDKWRTIPLDHPTAPVALAVREARELWMRSPEERSQIIPTTPGLTADEEHQAWAVLPFNIDDQLQVVFGLDFDTPQIFDETEKTFLITLTNTCAQALARAYLSERLQETAAVEERHRLARDLHDAVKQLLFASSAMAEALPLMLEQELERAREISLQIHRLNRAALAEMQILLQTMLPESITRTPFNSLLQNLCEGLEGKKKIESTLHWNGPTELYLPAEVHTNLYRLAQEALNNIAKHSQASQVIVHCDYSDNRFDLEIRDDGQGFDLKRASVGFGMNSMRERALLVGAKFNVKSTPGKGTTVTVKWHSLSEE